MTDLLVAESGIRQLHGRYIDAVWRRDASAFVDCFIEDGEWKIAGRHIRGREALGGHFEKFMAASERVLMTIGLPVLEVGQGTATGRVHVSELVKLKDGGAVRTIAIYYERFVEQPDRWRFQWRHFNLYHYGPPDLSAPYYPCLEYGSPPGMPGLDDPTTVRKR